ncbi:MAG TPA: UbiA-like polyprenyltransferase [Bacillota bacterium]|nr:UbiA-like polyprenyltransferase [Bacillota bacterium]
MELAKGINKVKIFTEMIKIEHTVFALPFAYIGALLPQAGNPGWGKIFWITLAMVGARTAAMSLNRVIDRQIDAQNPRTVGRALPQGLLSVAEVWGYVFASLLLLYVAAAQLNPLCVKLMPIAVFFLVLYPYMKRFSWLCHLVLGIALGLAPLGSWVAVTGSVDLPPVLLALGVTFWVAGFDVVYACQDFDFDRQAGLHSIPARFGLKLGLRIAVVHHVAAVAFLAAAGLMLNIGLFYSLGVLIAATILIYEHSLVKPHDLSKVDAAFFSMNGILSIMMFVFTLLAIIFPLR